MKSSSISKFFIILQQFFMIPVILGIDLFPVKKIETSTEPLYGVVIDLGSVAIPDEECDHVMTPYLQNCKDNYHEAITSVAIEYGNDFSTESVKRVACCGIWAAKQCAIEASELLEECGKNISALYRKLPSDPKIKATVMDKCSEYEEDSAICSTRSTSSWFTLNSLIVFLSFVLIFVFIGLVAFKIYENREKLKEKLNQKKPNQLENGEDDFEYPLYQTNNIRTTQNPIRLEFLDETDGKIQNSGSMENIEMIKKNDLGPDDHMIENHQQQPPLIQED